MPSSFTHTEPELRPILEDLIQREPLFHRPRFDSTHADFAHMLAPGYWEVGASGRRYSRAFILAHLRHSPPVDADKEGWQVLDAACCRLGATSFVLTYTLHQGTRRTRRSTLWQTADGHWQVLYHQGTIISTEEDDNTPSEPSAA